MFTSIAHVKCFLLTLLLLFKLTFGGIILQVNPVWLQASNLLPADLHCHTRPFIPIWCPPSLPVEHPQFDTNNGARSDGDRAAVVMEEQECDDSEEETWFDERGSADLTFGPEADGIDEAPWDQFAANHEGLIGFKRVIPFKEEFYTTALPKGPRELI